MRITALVKSSDHVCCRYRIAAFRSAMQQAGHDLAVRSWSSRWLFQQALPFFRERMDALIIQRKLFSSWQLNFLRRRVRWLIYDFDDAIFLNSSYSADGLNSPKRKRQFQEVVCCADIVTPGNDFLHEQAAAFTDSAKVHRIPTCVDVSRYPLARHDETRENVKLAWIGSASTLRGIERIHDHLNHLGQCMSRLELKVIADRTLHRESLKVEFRNWSEAAECADLADADIGISWLPDDSWSEGKCGLKVLQYMAAGLPVVANPVGMQRALVRHGENGFLAETRDEWKEAVLMLARDAGLRRRMGLAGRQLVESQYDVRVGAATWLSILQSLSRPTTSAAIGGGIA